MLYCIASPEEGAETLFASAATLFSRLSPEQQEFAKSAVALRSNECNAGGPAAFDAHFGLRMSHTGCRRIRAASHRRSTWTLNPNSRPVSGVDAATGERLFWGAAKNFDRFEGMDADASRDKMEELMHTAFFGVGNRVPDGEYDEDLRTMSRTDFPEDVVMAAKWRPKMAVIWSKCVAPPRGRRWRIATPETLTETPLAPADPVSDRVLHSTTPVALYKKGVRKMMHMIMQSPGEGLVKYQ